MALLPIEIPWTQKPPLGTPINWSHPLTKGLQICQDFNEQAGQLAFNAAANTSANSLQGDAVYNTDGLYCPGVNGAVSVPAFAGVDNMSNYTLFASIKPKTPANNDRIFDKNRWYLLWTTGGNLTSARTATGGNANTVTSGGLVPAGARKVVAAVFTGSTNLIRIFVGGVEASYSTQTAGVPAYTGDQGTLIHTGKANINTAYWDGEIHFSRVYNRALSPDEIANLSANPWQIYKPEVRWVNLAGGASASLLEGILSGSSSPSAALTTAITLAAQSGGNASITADLITAIRLAGTVQGAAQATAALTTIIQLAAISSGVGSISGELAGTIAAAILGGTAAGTSSATAQLSTAILLSGAAAGAGITTGQLAELLQHMAQIMVTARDPLALTITARDPLALKITARA